MINSFFHKNRRGVALISVVILCTVLVCMIGMLFYNTRAKKASYGFQYDTTRALMAANAAVQIAIYKYRILTTEYYKINELELKIKGAIAGSSISSIGVFGEDINELKAKLAKAKEVWLSDLSTKTRENAATDLSQINRRTALRIKEYYEKFAQEKDFEFGVDSFDLVSYDADGYSKDYIKIKAWGSYNGMRKDVEELIEVSVAR